MKTNSFFSQIEILETRIAPAVMLTPSFSNLGAFHTATYTDVDGDIVKITATSFPSGGGIFTANMFETTITGLAEQLERLDLHLNNTFEGANLVFTVTQVVGGNGLANVGSIDSTGFRLGTVTVKGDLGQIDATSNITAVPAIKSLVANSMGRFGADTQAAGTIDPLHSQISGALGSLLVKHDVIHAFIDVTGADGKIGPIMIKGSLIGGSTTSSGSISASVSIDRTMIKGDVEGGTGDKSGYITSGGTLAMNPFGLEIGGSLIGGSNANSGTIFSTGNMGKVVINHNVQGGTATRTGLIATQAALTSVNISGSLIGGADTFSGAIRSDGAMGPVNIDHDVQGSSGAHSGDIESLTTIASVTIGGSLIGGPAVNSGEINSTGDMGKVTIGHDVVGGAGSASGVINSLGKLAGVQINGSLYGGSNAGFASTPIASGGIFSLGDMGPVKITHDMLGGTGFASGSIQCNSILTSVKIGGSLTGGTGDKSGTIFVIGNLGTVWIGHDFTGGSISGTTAGLDRSGFITSSTGRIVGVTIGGSIITGTDTSTNGNLSKNASIRAWKDLGFLYVGGNIIGTGASPVVISASGQLAPSATVDLAIGPITVVGRVEHTNFLAGYDFNLNAVNGDASISLVNVGANWVASNLVAGVMNTASGNTNFGDANDAPIGGSLISKIVGIIIKGQVFGTPTNVNNTDHFGFVANHVVSLAIGTPSNPVILLNVGPLTDDRNVGETVFTTLVNDVKVHEM